MVGIAVLPGADCVVEGSKLSVKIRSHFMHNFFDPSFVHVASKVKTSLRTYYVLTTNQKLELDTLL